MSNKKKRPLAFTAFLFIGIAFITIGMSGNSAFIPIGCAFIAIGVAGVARSRKALRDGSAPDETQEK
jgi:hypothetical protein